MPSSGVQTCARSEEHTSELQSHDNLVCRLLLEKKKLHERDVRPRQKRPAPRHFGSRRERARDQRPGRGGSLCHPGPRAVSLHYVFFFNEDAAPELLPFSPTHPLPP